MGAIHRDGDSRACGGKTVVTGQSSVYVNGKLASVINDQNNHGAGNLLATNSGGTVFIGGKPICLKDSAAMPDALCSNGNSHCRPKATAGSPDVNSA